MKKLTSAKSTALLAINRAIELPADSSQAWCHVAPFGQFPTTLIHAGGKQERKVLTYDRDGFEMVVEKVTALCSRAGFRGLRVNKDHLAHFQTGNTECVAEVKGAKIVGDGSAEGDGLHYLVDFNPPGAALIRNRVYSYLSGEFDCGTFDDGVSRIYAPDEKWAAALTNDPNLPVTALNRGTVLFVEDDALALNHGGFVTIDGHVVYVGPDKDETEDGDRNAGVYEKALHDHVHQLNKAGASLSVRPSPKPEHGSHMIVGKLDKKSTMRSVKVVGDPKWLVPFLQKNYPVSSTAHNRSLSSTSADAGAGHKKPAAKAASTKGKTTMDYKAMLIDLLGLKATADDQEIEAAFKTELPEEDEEHGEGADETAKAQNRIIRLQAKRIADLHTAQLTQEADAFCDQHKTQIRNRAAVREQYLADAAGTKKLFEAFAAPAAAAPVKVFNRAEAQTPGERALDPEEAKKQRKQAQEAEVSRVHTVFKCRNRTEALDMAQRMNPALFV